MREKVKSVAIDRPACCCAELRTSGARIDPLANRAIDGNDQHAAAGDRAHGCEASAAAAVRIASHDSRSALPPDPGTLEQLGC